MTRRPVAFELRSYGYDPTLLPYANANNPNTWAERTPDVLEQVSPTPKTYAPGLNADVATMTWSHTGDVTGQVIPVKRITIPPAGTADGTRSGCAISDFPPEVQGNIALIQRGQLHVPREGRQTRAPRARRPC